MNVAVVALGKIGLPLAVQIAQRGHRVFGADISAAVVGMVNQGRAPFPGEAGLDERLAAVVASGTLTASTSTADVVAASDAVIVVVPLVVDGLGIPDFAALDAATVAIAEALRPGQLVSFETTLPVYTTRRRLAPLLERGSGLRAGSDFHVVHSPERVFSGRVFADLRRYPKLVGGLTPACAAAGVALYEAILEFDHREDVTNGVWDMGSAEAAEMAKLAETTYRDVNIALANEFARFAESAGLDIYRVIEAANSQPFSHVHRPGVAVGGHCIPVYPRFYLAGDPAARLPLVAREVNESMPGHVVGTLEGMLGSLEGQIVLVLGAAYRGGVKETAFSGVFSLVEEIRSRGGRPVVSDPLYSAAELRRLGLTPHEPGSPVDAVVVHTDHREYRELRSSDFPGCRAVIDGRRVLDPAAWIGVQFHTLGIG